MNESFLSSINTQELSLTADEAATLAKELTLSLKKGQKLEGTESQIRALIAGLADQRGLLRRTFSESLGLIGPKALPQLRQALLNSKNVTVRRAAAKTLKLVGDPEALPDLLKALLNDEDPVVQGSSAGAIAIFGGTAVEYLVKVLEHPQSSSTQCGLARWGLAFIGAKGSKEIKKAAKSKNQLVRASAIAALGDQIENLNDRDAKNIVKEALNDPSYEVQIEAIRLINFFQQEEWFSRALIDKLNSDNNEVRKQTALSLMRFNALGQVSYLQQRLDKEKNIEVIKIIKLAINSLTNI
ncbi:MULTISPECIES: HEAT repeat domain-containing protein [Prochlorococcus]|uniref:HEAT repeat domain-containing protein n=1 Tax=Prochlorococcus TaxID=1218 RepID=UPI0005337543|nr:MULTISPECIES: HEAT repeat domain-containing protein [Prochlorococcus]KGG13055.1 Bilin biosynthesis protein MpeU [Prochlorococcus sp. MIT 0601]